MTYCSDNPTRLRADFNSPVIFQALCLEAMRIAQINQIRLPALKILIVNQEDLNHREIKRHLLHYALGKGRNSSQRKLYLSQTLKEKSNVSGKVKDEEHLRQRGKSFDPEWEGVRLQGKSRGKANLS